MGPAYGLTLRGRTDLRLLEASQAQIALVAPLLSTAGIDFTFWSMHVNILIPANNKGSVLNFVQLYSIPSISVMRLDSGRPALIAPQSKSTAY
jgi:hypothetical protein